jgi:hypothetical protein
MLLRYSLANCNKYSARISGVTFVFLTIFCSIELEASRVNSGNAGSGELRMPLAKAIASNAFLRFRSLFRAFIAELP